MKNLIRLEMICKGDVRVYESLDSEEKIIFKKDKVYEVWVQPYFNEHSQKINGGGYMEYYIVDDLGRIRNESKAWMNAMFKIDPAFVRDDKLNKIINEQ